MKKRLQGSLPAVPTPFDTNGHIDFGAFRELMDFHAAHGSDAVFLMGTAGEPTLLSLEERKQIVHELVPACKGRIPAYFGATLPTTEQTVEFAKYAEAEGADGLIFSAPAYILPSQEALTEFMRTAMNSVSIPVGIYHNLGRTGVMLTVDNLEKLIKDCPNLSVIKESSSNTRYLVEIGRRLSDSISIMGVDAPSAANMLYLFALGAQGVSNACGNVIPSVMSEMSQPWTTFEQMERCKKLYAENFALLEAVNRYSSPIGVKAAMNLMGLPGGHTRRPNLDLSGAELESLKTTLTQYGLMNKYR